MKMNSDNWLGLFIVSVLGIAAYMFITRPDDHDPYGSLEEDWWG